MENYRRAALEFMNFANLIRREMDSCGSERCIRGMTMPNARFIAYLFKNGDRDVYQKDLEAAFSIRPSTVSRSLKLLEQQGYIVRTSSEADARLKKITLTEEAQKINEEFENAISLMFKKMTRDISDEDIEAFLKTLDKMKDNLAGGVKA